MKKLSGKFCKISGSIMIASSLIIFGLSGYMYLKPYQSVNLVQLKQKAYSNCDKAAKGFELAVEKEPAKNKIHFSSSGVNNWAKDIANSSLLIKSCEGFEIQQYCYGTCKPHKSKTEVTGLIMTLKYIEPKIEK